jgi:hypothetical protein
MTPTDPGYSIHEPRAVLHIEYAAAVDLGAAAALAVANERLQPTAACDREPPRLKRKREPTRVRNTEMS